MRRGAGKAKGSAFERDIARALSLWITNGADNKQLIRSVLSGGWSASRAPSSDEGWRHVGDLAPNGPEGEVFRRKVAVECKHHREIDLYGLWTRSDGIVEWWKKLREEAEPYHMEPLLVFRQNGRPIMAAISNYVHHFAGYSSGMHMLSMGMTILPLTQLLANPAKDFLDAHPSAIAHSSKGSALAGHSIRDKASTKQSKRGGR